MKFTMVFWRLSTGNVCLSDGGHLGILAVWTQFGTLINRGAESAYQITFSFKNMKGINPNPFF